MNTAPRTWIRNAGLSLVAALGFVATAMNPVEAEPNANSDGQATAATIDQVVTWGASADRTAASVAGQTVRNIVHTSIGGSNLRISLSNAFGDRSLTFDAVYIGLQDRDASLVPGSNRRVTFAGENAVTVPNGAEVLSDPLDGPIPAQQTLAISIHVTGDAGTVTGHNVANQSSYLSAAGDHAAEESGAAFTKTISNWYWVETLVVDVPARVDTVAAFGDSITDGNGSTKGANRRWPDYLARRILGLPAPHQFGVMNEGISGNRVLADGPGVSAQARFDRDVLSKPDVKTVVLMQGVNDIRWQFATSPEDLIAAYRQLIARAHAKGICVIGGTMTPFEGGSLYSDEKDAIREGVNEFIRNSGEFDAVVDFDKVTRDPANPKRFLSAYDSGDHLHPGDAGYAAMADAVDLRQLECNR